MWVAGAELAGLGPPEVVANPATEELLAEVGGASAEQVDQAVRAAGEAATAWRRTPAGERGELLHQVTAWLRSNTEGLARTLTLEGGKPLVENVDEVGWTANAFAYYAELGRHERGRVIPSVEDGQLSLVLKEPVGVVAAIVPWNSPLLLLTWKLAPALAAGCTVVVKPSEFASGVAHRYAELIAELDLPPGVFNLVTGLGDTGAALAAHPGLDKITFTGRREVGERVVAGAGTRSVALELGGKSPSIVFDDVPDLDAAARTAMSLVSMGLSGQVCSTQTRALVQRGVYEAFLESARAQTADVRYGDPFDPATTSAPIVTPAAAQRVLRLVDGAVADGGRLVTGGGPATPPGAAAGGNWVEPTLIADVDPRMPIADEEVFGPVLAVIPFDDEDEAVRLANGSAYGLSAGVYTGDVGRALRVGRRLRTGTVGINGPFVFTPGTPFGGYKASGVGREGGREGIEEFLETKTITVRLD
jgi:aldehyde dehydrogenase (NAD+)